MGKFAFFFIFLFIGCAISALFVGRGIGLELMRKEAIEKGFAEYNRATGN